MKVLVACEESQRVCTAFREKGHNAFSCDILPCSGGHPDWHIQEDVLKILNPYELPFGGQVIEFRTMDGKDYAIEKWDLIIAFPPCTYLTVTGNRWFNVEKYGEKAIQRQKNRDKAIKFVMGLEDADCYRIAIENPVGVLSTHFRKPDQIIQPWQFALSEEEKTEKSTCLWLKGLNRLVPRTVEKPELSYHEWTTPNGKKKRQTLWYYRTRCLPNSERAKAASKTFPGIAKAMAEQWGDAIWQVDRSYKLM